MNTKPDGLTDAELAERAGVSLERLKRLVEVGVVRPSDAGRFRPIDPLRFYEARGAKGDEEAAKLAVRLSDLVQESAASRHGRAVKSLGDGVMLHFRDSGEAVAAALDLVDATPMAGLPPARVGITSGPVVFRDGDYFGRAVNMASRITDYARRLPSQGHPAGPPSKKSES